MYDKPEYGDRYTVYFNVVEKDRPRMYMCFCMDAHPFHPQGIGQHSMGQLGPHNGKKISFRQLPADCQKAVMLHLKEENDPPRLNPFIKKYHIWIHHKYQGYVESAKSGEAAIAEITHDLPKRIRSQIREAKLEPASYGGAIHFLGWGD